MKISKEDLSELIQSGKYQHEIAKELGCSQTTISNYCKKYNLVSPKRPAKNRNDLTDREIGKLKVIKYEYTIKKVTYWLCQCECGNQKVINGKHLSQNNIDSCGCNQRGKPSPKRTGFGEISGSYIASIKLKACQRNIEYNISPQDMWNQFLCQNRKCALSGDEITFPSNQHRKFRSLQTASLDRKDSSMGYTVDNIQWVHKHLNIIKSDFPDKDFIEWCTKVANHAKENH